MLYIGIVLADGIIDLCESENAAETLYNECMKRTDNLGVDVILDLQCKVSESRDLKNVNQFLDYVLV